MGLLKLIIDFSVEIVCTCNVLGVKLNFFTAVSFFPWVISVKVSKNVFFGTTSQLFKLRFDCDDYILLHFFCFVLKEWRATSFTSSVSRHHWKRSPVWSSKCKSLFIILLTVNHNANTFENTPATPNMRIQSFNFQLCTEQVIISFLHPLLCL